MGTGRSKRSGEGLADYFIPLLSLRMSLSWGNVEHQERPIYCGRHAEINPNVVQNKIFACQIFWQKGDPLPEEKKSKDDSHLSVCYVSDVCAWTYYEMLAKKASPKSENRIKAIDFYIILDEMPNLKFSLITGVFRDSNKSSSHYSSSRNITFSLIFAVMDHEQLAKRS